MKMSIAWHKEALKNTYASLERKKKQLEQLQIEVERQTKQAIFYHVQIHEAEMQGKDSFDSDLFLKKHKHNYGL